MTSSDAQRLYTRQRDRYAAFVRFFRSGEGLRCLFDREVSLPPGARLLDAGCGFGLATFALLEARRTGAAAAARIDAFDLTPAMLENFQRKIDARGLARIRLRAHDALATEDLPPDWCDYDLILSTSMLEYLPTARLPAVLAGLRRRLKPSGCLVVMITRRTFETWLLIERIWQAGRYTTAEVRQLFAAAGYARMRFAKFPWTHGWLNRANHVVIAEP